MMGGYKSGFTNLKHTNHRLFEAVTRWVTSGDGCSLSRSLGFQPFTSCLEPITKTDVYCKYNLQGIVGILISILTHL